MGDRERPWAIDAGLARDLADALGWQPDDGLSALAASMPASVPMGSTAKLAAIAAGEVPPGAEPADLAGQLLAHGQARATDPEDGASSPSWSCWVAATVMAALVDAAGIGPVHVAATRRCDADAPMVDFHAAVVVPGDDEDWICDPYFGVAIALPAGDRTSATVTDPLGTVTAGRTTDRGWHYDLGFDVWDIVLRFQRLAPTLDADDVRAMAAISVTHSGVPLRPYARLHVEGAVVDASEAADGTGVVRVWTPADGRQEQTVATWADAVDEFAERTGSRII